MPTDCPVAVRETCQALVSVVGANAAPWQHWEETVSAVFRAIERAGFRVEPAAPVLTTAQIDATAASLNLLKDHALVTALETQDAFSVQEAFRRVMDVALALLSAARQGQQVEAERNSAETKLAGARININRLTTGKEAAEKALQVFVNRGNPACASCMQTAQNAVSVLGAISSGSNK